MIPSAAQVDEARTLLSRHLQPTRLVRAPSLERHGGGEVYLKLECDLPTGSFKPRGALYALHRTVSDTGASHVVAASTGNHGAAVAYAARLLGVPATIFLPENANRVKRDRIASLGAHIVERGADISAAIAGATAFAGEGGTYFLHDAADPHVPAGTATIAGEILDVLPRPDAILVPMGDTALIRGVAAESKRRHPAVRVVGVAAERAPAYARSWREGHAVATETCDTIADGLAVRQPLEGNVEDIRRLVDDVHLVSEDHMLEAIRALVFDEHIVAEPAGAAATAAFLGNAGAYAGATVVILVTGSNVAPDVLRRALATA